MHATYEGSKGAPKALKRRLPLALWSFKMNGSIKYLIITFAWALAQSEIEQGNNFKMTMPNNFPSGQTLEQ